MLTVSTLVCRPSEQSPPQDMLKAAGANSQGSASSLARHAVRKFPLRRLAVVGLLAAAVLFYGKEAMWCAFITNALCPQSCRQSCTAGTGDMLPLARWQRCSRGAGQA